jgi:hypothetical protein
MKRIVLLTLILVFLSLGVVQAESQWQYLFQDEDLTVFIDKDSLTPGAPISCCVKMILSDKTKARYQVKNLDYFIQVIYFYPDTKPLYSLGTIGYFDKDKTMINCKVAKEKEWKPMNLFFEKIYYPALDIAIEKMHSAR